MASIIWFPDACNDATSECNRFRTPVRQTMCHACNARRGDFKHAGQSDENASEDARNRKTSYTDGDSMQTYACAHCRRPVESAHGRAQDAYVRKEAIAYAQLHCVATGLEGQERHGYSAHAHRVSPDRRHRRGIGHAVRRCGDRGTECGECGASRHRQSRLPKATGIQMIAFQQT